VRLIDADALMEKYMVYDEIVGQYIPAYFIKKAPTVSCKECAFQHDLPYEEGKAFCSMLRVDMPEDFGGCAYFERRQP
jgi:hypothetical protein